MLLFRKLHSIFPLTALVCYNMFIGVRGILGGGGEVIFIDFFLVENSHFNRHKTSFSGLEKWKSTWQKKEGVPSSLSPFHF